MQRKILILFILAALAAPGSVLAQCPGPTIRTTLINLQKSLTVEGSKAGQIPLTDACGNQRYAQYVEVDLVPISYTPTLTGNTQNYSEFVIGADSAVYYIDWQGRSRKFPTGGAGGCDEDWLEIGNNLCPDAITDSIYKYKYVSVGARYVWPLAEILISDSSAAAVAVISGDRNARLVFYDNLNQKYSTIDQGGTSTVWKVQPGGDVRIQSASGGTPQAPGGTLVNHFGVATADSSVTLYRYGNTRNDTAAVVNVLSTTSTGKVQSNPVSEVIAAGGGTTGANNGASVSSSTVQLGNANGGTAAQLINNREIPLNGKKLSMSGNTGQLILGDTISRSFYTNTGDSYPRLTIVDKAGGSNVNSPLINVVGSKDLNTFFQFNPINIDTGSTPFSFSYGIGRNLQSPNINDNSYTWGVNKNAQGIRYNTSQPALNYSYEDEYFIVDRWFLEHYLTIDAKKPGRSSRAWYYIADRDSLSVAQSIYEASSYSWRNIPMYYANTAYSQLDNMSLSCATPSAGTVFTVGVFGAAQNTIQLKGSAAGASYMIGHPITGIMKNAISAGGYDATKAYLLFGGTDAVIGLDNEIVNLNASGGRMSIAGGANTNSTIHLGRDIADGFVATKNNGVQINNASGSWDVNGSSGGGGDILRLNNTTAAKRWGLGIVTNGMYFAPVSATPGGYSLFLVDPAAGLSIYDVEFFGNKGIKIPNGTTAQRPTSPENGTLRFNSTLDEFEGKRAAGWAQLIAGTGTVNVLPKFSTANTLGNSIISDDGSKATITGNAQITGRIGVNAAPDASEYLLVKNTAGNPNGILVENTAVSGTARLSAKNSAGIVASFATYGPSATGEVSLDGKSAFGSTGSITIYSDGATESGGTASIAFQPGGYDAAAEVMRLQSGKVGIGLTSMTALCHIKAGTSTANTAPLKLTSGTNLTTPEAGAIEYDGNEYYGTPSSASRHILARVLKGSATLDFASQATGTESDLTITVTGATDGDPVFLGVPNGSVNAGCRYFAWVSSPNTVSVRHNNQSGGTVDPASGPFKVTVNK